MPHEPLTGDALLDALAEVPGDPAEPVPAPVPMRRRDYKLTPEDIAAIKDRQRREAEANPIFPPGGLTLRVPSDIAEQSMRDVLNRLKRDADSPVAMVRKICPELRDRVPTQIVQNPYTIEPGQALDDAARRSVEARKSESLLPPTPRVITWDPVPLAITSWRVFINPTEEENPE